ncbi:outer membrane beta-barrel protein [Paraburkholderia sp. 1N]|uniref:Lipid A deacylase n=1 Tax=Paraburkholderia solitsugae TaxID=2675748 RepID=A0ABX2BHX8_9BURK|nr:acyloxyacyl hydrolase [Paraburkholderia solitsugae]NPT40522.1 outer membrane beta-barrel protein [Paraburkholderia solitsugae]
MRTFLRTVLLCILIAGSQGSQASEFGIQLGGGVADHDVKKGDLGLDWDPGVSWWNIAGYYFTVVGEAHAAYWNIDESGRARSSIWEFGVTPVVRFIRSSGWFRPYVEVGVGVRLLSHVRETDDRTFSSSFQFADLVGVGFQFGERQNYQVAFRFQHLSNAGIKHPNPGINFSEIYFQYNF